MHININDWHVQLMIFISLCSYLHKNDIVHGNLSLASIFIQHNGLVKIGSGDPVACYHRNL